MVTHPVINSKNGRTFSVNNIVAQEEHGSNNNENGNAHFSHQQYQILTNLLKQENASVGDGDQDQEEIEAEDQGQEELEAEVEEAQGDTSLPQRLTRDKFKELGSSGRLFSLFIVSFV